MSFQACGVYSTDDSYFVFTQSVTERGVGVSMGPFFRAAGSAGPAELGHTVLTAIAGSRQGVPDPTEPRQVTKALLRFAGCKSWASFARSVRGHAAIGLDGHEAVMIPHKRGPNSSFLGVDERTIRCSPTELEIGTRLLEMLGPAGTDRLPSSGARS